MTTQITKEWLQQTIAEYEASRDEIPFGLETNSAMELEAFKIALAAMGAEPAGYHVIKECGQVGCSVATFEEAQSTRDFWNKRWTIKPYFYAAPPAPVFMPDEMEPTVKAIKRVLPTSNPDEYAACIGADMWNACRAAMLQGADGALIREGTRQTDELVMWIKRLAHSLRKANPDSKLQSDAMEYLNLKGLIRVEDVLR